MRSAVQNSTQLQQPLKTKLTRSTINVQPSTINPPFAPAGGTEFRRVKQNLPESVHFAPLGGWLVTISSFADVLDHSFAGQERLRRESPKIPLPPRPAEFSLAGVCRNF